MGAPNKFECSGGEIKGLSVQATLVCSLEHVQYLPTVLLHPILVPRAYDLFCQRWDRDVI